MRTLPALTVLLTLAAPALAQDVVVNGDGSGQTLIDPATGQSRYVPALMQPWQNEAIRLRPPGVKKKVAKPATSAPATSASTSYSDTTAYTPPPAPKPARKVTAAAPAPSRPAPVRTTPARSSAPAAGSSLSGFADIDLITGGQRLPSAQPVQAAPKKAPEPKPTQTASIEKPKAKAPTGNRRDSISFAPNASDPTNAAVSAVRALANSLSASLGDGSARVQLMAYAGPRGEKSSDTRRLSLKRALVVRQLLIDDGLPSDRIDVFALGGSDDNGPLDRVDVYVKN